jgi:hypothetical protein
VAGPSYCSRKFQKTRNGLSWLSVPWAAADYFDADFRRIL